MATPPDPSNWHPATENDLHTIPHCYCPNCHSSNATTHLLPTQIPLFREIIVLTLQCPDCNFSNSEVTFGGRIQEQGEVITLSVGTKEDLNRQMVKSDSATVKICAVGMEDLEIPRKTQVGVSTVEGVLRKAMDNLESLQGERLKLGDVDNFYRCRTVIQTLKLILGDEVAFRGDENDNDEHVNEKDPTNGRQDNQQGFLPFQLILDDPAGNSFIENPLAPSPDPNMKSEKYIRTPMQDMSLGLQPSPQAKEAGIIDDSLPSHKNVVNVPKGLHSIEIDQKIREHLTRQSKLDDNSETSNSPDTPNTPEPSEPSEPSKKSESSLIHKRNLGREEAIKFPTPCPHCYQPSETSMCITDIPHFKEIILMCLLCDHCGYKSNEIKGGGCIPPFGTKITLHVSAIQDLEREVLKSDTAGVAIPELELELKEGGLDGMYTTVEGLLKKMHGRLVDANPFGVGDSSTKQHLENDGGEFSRPKEEHVRYAQFLEQLSDVAEGKRLPFTLVISDPLSNSFIGPVPDVAVDLSLRAEREGTMDCYQDFVDPGMEIEEYERTVEQNEVLGLNDLQTENYQTGNDCDGDDLHATRQYYGTDKMEELPERLRRLDHRGPDHPQRVGMPAEVCDTTIMGKGTKTHAVPAMFQRGNRRTPAVVNSLDSKDNNISLENATNVTHK